MFKKVFHTLSFQGLSFNILLSFRRVLSGTGYRKQKWPLLKFIHTCPIKCPEVVTFRDKMP